MKKVKLNILQLYITKTLNNALFYDTFLLQNQCIYSATRQRPKPSFKRVKNINHVQAHLTSFKQVEAIETYHLPEALLGVLILRVLQLQENCSQ